MFEIFSFKLCLSSRFLALDTPKSVATPLKTSLVVVLCSCALPFRRQYGEYFDAIFVFRGRSGRCNTQKIRINLTSAGCFSFRSPTLPPNFYFFIFLFFMFLALVFGRHLLKISARRQFSVIILVVFCSYSVPVTCRTITVVTRLKASCLACE